jgi:hypothetical protein
MDITLRRYIAVTSIFMLLPGYPAYAQPGATQGYSKSLDQRYSQKALLKNWALSVCLAEVAQDAKTRADANETASAYLEFGRQQIEAYDMLKELVKKFADRKYEGSIKSEFNTMKCIDLFYSIELDRLTAKLSKKK